MKTYFFQLFSTNQFVEIRGFKGNNFSEAYTKAEMFADVYHFNSKIIYCNKDGKILDIPDEYYRVKYGFSGR